MNTFETPEDRAARFERWVQHLNEAAPVGNVKQTACVGAVEYNRAYVAFRDQKSKIHQWEIDEAKMLAAEERSGLLIVKWSLL